MIVTQSVAKSLGCIHVDVLVDEHADASEILPPYGRLNDKKGGASLKKKINPCQSVESVVKKPSHKTINKQTKPDKTMNNQNIWQKILHIAITILTAIATTLGTTS